MLILLMTILLNFINLSATNQLSAYDDDWNDMSAFREDIKDMGIETRSLVSSPLLLLITAFFLLKPGAVVALPRHPSSVIDFKNPLGHIIKEIAIVSHCDNRTSKLLQVPFKPCNGVRIQMVCRLVQQQDVRLTQQQPAECYTPTFAARKFVDKPIWRGTR